MMMSWLTLLFYIVALTAAPIMATEMAAGPPQICTPPASVECARSEPPAFAIRQR